MKLKEIFERFAVDEGDTDDQRFSKNPITTISVSCCFFGLIWGGLYYFFLGYGLTMYLPWLFVLFIGISIPIFFVGMNRYKSLSSKI